MKDKPIVDKSSKSIQDGLRNFFSELTTDQLRERLHGYVDDEEFEFAAVVRDMIAHRLLKNATIISLNYNFGEKVECPEPYLVNFKFKNGEQG